MKLFKIIQKGQGRHEKVETFSQVIIGILTNFHEVLKILNCPLN